MEYKIEEMKSSDWEQVKNIYLEGIKTEIATFQSECNLPTWESWESSHISSCSLVAHLENNVLGWAVISAISSRCVYSGVGEVSVYIGEKYKGYGIGTALLNNLVELSEENGFSTLQAQIIRENTASISLHKKCGFREVGIREKMGKMKNGKWHDVVLMERRSRRVGVN